jgi:hypothetical protein
MPGFNPQPSRRRWLMPVAILLVGGAIAWWASAREKQRMHAVESRVRAICDSLAKGRDLVGEINADNPAAEGVVIDALRRALGGRDDAELVQIRVVSGDTFSERAGSAANLATHTAVLHMDGIELLALRARCDDPNDPVKIIGYVVPPPNS